LFYIDNDLLHVYDFFLKKEDVFLLPRKGVKKFLVKNSQSIYLQTEHALEYYHFSGKWY
jgi:hypothetical protein